MQAVMRLALAAVAGIGLAACNTMEGLGRDLEAGGRAVARSAAEVRADIQAENVQPPDTTPEAREVTAQEARARALSARPGVIVNEETKADQAGGTHYVFRIRGEDEQLYLVDVDAQSGAVAQHGL